jgi:acetylornithine deacetylase/succinyl-diaminopimelate desuccinylase-like protein
MELTAIPAPPFGEEERGRRFEALFREIGLADVARDVVGNVVGWYRGGQGSDRKKPGPGFLVVSAHLDTVFPADTDVTPRLLDGRILAPGISDDGRGLAGVLALARTMAEKNVLVPHPIAFVGTVGEEGPGDLRGVRHLFDSDAFRSETLGFISLDGVGVDKIITGGVGSIRFRLTLRGAGGHSWMDFGRANPIHTLASVVARAQQIGLSTKPKTTLTVARWGGGTSINAIPEKAWVEMDLRSEDGGKLESLEEAVLTIVDVETQRKKAESGLTLELTRIGRRPAGSMPEDHPLVAAARKATSLVGSQSKLISSSTDANYPMSLGIPSITLGAGGRAGGIHTLAEWYENTSGPEGILRALLTTLLFLEEHGGDHAV